MRVYRIKEICKRGKIFFYIQYRDILIWWDVYYDIPVVLKTLNTVDFNHVRAVFKTLEEAQNFIKNEKTKRLKINNYKNFYYV